ncbi:MAG: hypothetical protein Q9201_000370 [Fulgogasparrea decipioides]
MPSSVNDTQRFEGDASGSVAPLEAVVSERGSQVVSSLANDDQDSNVPQEPDWETPKEKRARHRAVLERLKSFARWEEEYHESLRKYIARKLGISKRPPYPNTEELITMFDFFLPPTKNVIATVCDFGKSGSIPQRQRIKLDEMEEQRSKHYTDSRKTVDLDNTYITAFEASPASDSYRWM